QTCALPIWGAAAHTGLALARKANAGAFVHTRRDFDLKALFLLHPAHAAAGPAGLGDDPPGAPAGGAGALHHEEALGCPHLAHALAGGAGFRLGARFRAGAVARLARHGGGNGDGLRPPAVGVFQRDFEIVAQVGAAHRAGAVAAPAAAAHEFIEDVLENVGEAAAAEVVRPAAEAAAAKTAAAAERGLAVAIIGGPLLRVLQHVVGFADFLEPGFRRRIARVAVGVILHGQLAVSRLEGLVVCLPVNAKHLIIISV